MVEGPEEQSKFRALAARYERLMFHVARQILPNQQDAEDAIQEAFLAIAKKFLQDFCGGQSKTKAFVVIVTENKAIDIARKNARQVQQVPWRTCRGSPSRTGERMLTRCILRLPARYRAWIQLHYAQGYTAEETAEILGLSKEAGLQAGPAGEAAAGDPVPRGGTVMIPEESLRQAAQRAQEALLDSLPESPAAHTFSPAYRRKLDRLARRVDGKARPPHWILHRVAGILLAVVCLGGWFWGPTPRPGRRFLDGSGSGWRMVSTTSIRAKHLPTACWCPTASRFRMITSWRKVGTPSGQRIVSASTM